MSKRSSPNVGLSYGTPIPNRVVIGEGHSFFSGCKGLAALGSYASVSSLYGLLSHRGTPMVHDLLSHRRSGPPMVHDLSHHGTSMAHQRVVLIAWLMACSRCTPSFRGA